MKRFAVLLVLGLAASPLASVQQKLTYVDLVNGSPIRTSRLAANLARRRNNGPATTAPAAMTKRLANMRAGTPTAMAAGASAKRATFSSSPKWKAPVASGGCGPRRPKKATCALPRWRERTGGPAVHRLLQRQERTFTRPMLVHTTAANGYNNYTPSHTRSPARSSPIKTGALTTSSFTPPFRRERKC
jgi:hypothetical protein